MNTKFQELEAVYKRTKRLSDLVLLSEEASSFEELKGVCAYVIESGIYKQTKPEGRVLREHLHEGKYHLLMSVTHRLRVKMKTEDQIVEICNLSIENPFWRGYCWNNHGNDPHPKDILALREVAKSFKGYQLLYQYDYLRRPKYIEALKALVLTESESKQLNELLSA